MEKAPTVSEQETENNFERPTVYSFGLIDPRPIPAARETNEKMFNASQNGVLGVEMTVPEYLEKCDLGNIDPQHSDGDINTAAIDVAVSYPVPEDGVLMVTVRPDLDSLGTMALLNLRQKGLQPDENLLRRVKAVSLSDTFANGDWEPKALPNKDDIWAGVKNRELSAMSAAIMDFKLPVAERVKLMEEWLETGSEPVEYRERVEKDRLQLVEMLENGDIKYQTVHEGKLSLVTSTNIAGTTVGYSLSPVTAVTNPTFSFQGNEPVVKHTVCQFKLGHVDLPAVMTELNEIEPGWGGSPTIIGSPQGVSSAITQEQLSEIIGKHLT